MTSARFAALLCVQLVSAMAWAQTVSFDLPTTDVVNRSNVAFLAFGGSCSNVGEQVTVSGPSDFSATAQCRDSGRWDIANVSLTHLADGSLSFTARHASTAQASRTLRKDTVAPSLALQQPTNGSSIDDVNQGALLVRGTCGDLNQPVTVRARPASANAPMVERQLVCPASRSFSTTLDVSGLPDGDTQIFVQHRDAAGNTAQQDIILYKDAVPLQVTFTPVGTHISAQRSASLLLEGTCNKPGNALYLDVTGPSGYLVSLLTYCDADETWGFANVSVTDAPDEELTFTATLTHALTGGFVSVQVSALKDTMPPVVMVFTPAHGDRVTSATGTALHVSGTCSDATPVSVAVANQAAVETPCQSGAFSLQYDVAGLPDGDLVLRVLQTDEAGNVGRQDLSLQKDVQPASVSVTQPVSGAFINTANAASFRFTGACSEHGSFAEPVRLTGAVSATALCVAGSWSVTLSLTELPEGPVSVRVTHGDTAGNPPAEVLLSLTKDVVPPLLQITSPDANLGEKPIVNAGNVDTLEVLGSCSEDGRSLQVSGALAGTATCLGGAFAFRPDFQAAPDGDLLLHFTLTDAAGNSATQSLGLYKDVQPPAITLANAGDPLVLNAQNTVELVLSGECTEHGSFATPVALTAPTGALAVCVAGQWSLTLSLSGVPEGSGALRLEHTDRAGNRVRLVRAYVKDTVAPLLTLTQPGPGFHVTAANVAAVRMAGTCSEEGRAVELSGPLAASAVCTKGQYQVDVNLSGAPDGDVTLRATLTDAAGNATVQDVIVHKDTVVPTLTLTSVGDPVVMNATSSTGLWLMGECSEHSMPVELLSPVTATAACNGVTWSLMVSLTELPDGNGSLELKHRDVAGNAVRLTRAFRKDSVAPLLALARPAVNQLITASVQVSGTCSEEGRAVEVTAPVVSSAPCSGGAFSLTLNLGGVPDGDVAIRARLRDAAGNETRQDVLVLKDTLPPTLTLTNTGDPLQVSTTPGASLVLSGTCSEHAGAASPVKLLSPVTASAACNAGAWSLQVNTDGFPAGTGSVELSHSDVAGNTARVVRAYFKTPPVPLLAVTTPAAGSHVVRSVRVDGTCSEHSRLVELVAPVTNSTTCSSGRFSLQAYLSAMPEGPVTLRLRHTNVSGGEAILELPVTKDTVRPTLTLTQPAGWDLGAAEALVLQGTCSDPGRPVLIRGSVTGAVACAETKTFSTALPLTAWGTLKVDLEHRDLAGNSVTLSRSFERCVYAPRVPAPVVGPSGRIVEADFNADGVRDMALALQYGLSESLPDTGGIKVYLGRAATAPGDGGFEEPTLLPDIHYADNLTVADFNADGALDLLVYLHYSDGLQLMTGRMEGGRPTGTFNPPFAYAHLKSAGTVLATHVNDDGIIDLVLTSGYVNRGVPSAMMVSLGRQACGPGVDFEPQFVAHADLKRPQEAPVALADFNRDGRMDLAFADFGVNPTVLLRTTATGTQGLYQPVVLPLPTSLTPFFDQLITADLNGDSFMDIATSSRGADSVAVFYGRGDGTFTAVREYALGHSPGVLVAADVNADGYRDLVSGAVLGGLSLVPGRPGAGPGAYDFGPTVGYLTDFPINGLLVTDVNGDAVPDFVISEPPSRYPVPRAARLDIRLREEADLGPDPFHPPVAYGPSGHGNTYALVAEDFNADGILDLASVGSSGNLDILRGQGTGGVGNGTFSVSASYLIYSPYRTLVTADFNEDGAVDLAGISHGRLGILLANRTGGVADGTFAAPVTHSCLPPNSGSGSNLLLVGDFNGDGVLDLMCDYGDRSWNSPGVDVRVLWGRGTGGVGDGTFDPSVTVFSGVKGLKSAVAHDFNRDGVTDVALGSEYVGSTGGMQQEVLLLLGTGTPGAVFHPPAIYRGGGSAYSMKKGDYNADGVPDLLTWSGGGITSLLLGDATGGFTLQPGARVDSRGNTGSALEDYDQDGALDLLITGRNRIELSRRVTSAPGYRFHPHYIYSLPELTWGVVARDFNSDGVVDVAFGTDKVWVMLGRGSTAP